MKAPNSVRNRPAGVDGNAWDKALAEAQSKYGAGDKAYIEAQTSTLAGAPYCQNPNQFAQRNHPNQYLLVPVYGVSNYSCVLKTGAPGVGTGAYRDEQVTASGSVPY